MFSDLDDLTLRVRADEVTPGMTVDWEGTRAVVTRVGEYAPDRYVILTLSDGREPWCEEYDPVWIAVTPVLAALPVRAPGTTSDGEAIPGALLDR